MLEYPQRRRQLITTAANTYMGRPQKRYRKTTVRKHARSGRFLVIIANRWIKKQPINGGHCQISPCRDQRIPAVHQNHILYSSPIIIINPLPSIKDYIFVLTFKTLNNFMKTLKAKCFFFQFEIIITVLVMGLRPLEIFLQLQCEIDFSRQNLPSTDSDD